MTRDDLQKKILEWRIAKQDAQGDTSGPHLVRLTPAQCKLLGEHQMIFGMRIELRREGS